MITTKERIANSGAVSEFTLIVETCKFFAILFDDEYISLWIKYWNIRAEFEKCVYNWHKYVHITQFWELNVLIYFINWR